VLLTLGISRQEEPPVFSSLTTVDVAAEAESAPNDAPPDQAQDTPETPQIDQPQPVLPPLPSALPLPRPVQTPQPEVAPPVQQTPPPQQQAPPAPNRPRAVIRPGGGSFGPPGSAGRSEGDSEVVGTAPDGSPLYAARWYREPTDQEMAGYLSTVDPPAWALIACRTAPRWAVTDCVALEQYPTSSNIMNAVLASTWQYQVRPPRRGNQSLVGSWVRIRISYKER
jgi:periplasmic protein TonB